MLRCTLCSLLDHMGSRYCLEKKLEIHVNRTQVGRQPVASQYSLWLLWEAFTEPDGMGLLVCPHRPVHGVTRGELITVFVWDFFLIVAYLEQLLPWLSYHEDIASSLMELRSFINRTKLLCPIGTCSWQACGLLYCISHSSCLPQKSGTHEFHFYISPKLVLFTTFQEISHIPSLCLSLAQIIHLQPCSCVLGDPVSLPHFAANRKLNNILYIFELLSQGSV